MGSGAMVAIDVGDTTGEGETCVIKALTVLGVVDSVAVAEISGERV
jgi:hypothetical protein